MEPPHPKRLQNPSLVSRLRKGSPSPIQKCLSEVANERGEIAETPDGLHSNQYATRLLKKIEQKIDAEINGDRSHGDVQIDDKEERRKRQEEDVHLVSRSWWQKRALQHGSHTNTDLPSS